MQWITYDGEEPIEPVLDILSLDDDVRNELLQLSHEIMGDVAMFCNSYPSIDVAFDVQDLDDVATGEPVEMIVTLERDIDEDDMDEDKRLGVVSAPLFPKEKKEGWWIVVGDTQTNTLFSLKCVTLQTSQKVKLEFLAPEEAGDYNLTLFCMSDSYLGCDQELSVPLNVAVGGDSDSDENDSDSDE
jgi:pre-mRNA-splicing helicase BRR2